MEGLCLITGEPIDYQADAYIDIRLNDETGEGSIGQIKCSALKDVKTVKLILSRKFPWNDLEATSAYCVETFESFGSADTANDD